MLADTVAGYRLIRKLGSGSRADVFLGHAGGAEPRTAAIKVFHPEVSPESVDTELRALAAANHAHIVQVRDLSGGGDEHPVVVLERLELGSLAQLLAQRAQLAPGEAVTILAPLAAAVSALQASGISHGAITASRVLFRESGAPVLSGFGHAAVGVATDVDRRALAALAAIVLERVPQAADLRHWLEALVGYPESFADQLAEGVFALAPASAVRFAPDVGATHPVPARVAIAEPVTVIQAPSSKWWAPYLARIPERFRKPTWLAAAAGALTVIIAIALPTGGSAEQLTPTAAPTVAASGAIVEDDPVVAFETLIRVRNDCIRDLSILCLDAVLQADSGAMADDVELIRSIERGDGGDAVIEPAEPVLTERMGDAALLSYRDNGEPASVLLVKTEAGWRVRSWVPS